MKTILLNVSEWKKQDKSFVAAMILMGVFTVVMVLVLTIKIK